MKTISSFVLCVLFVFSLQSQVNKPPTIEITQPVATNQNIPVDIKFSNEIHRSGGNDSIQKPGGGDNFCNTWAADDKIYVTVDDGMGWQKEVGSPKVELNNRVWALSGGPEKYKPEYLEGFPEYELRKDLYGFGILAVDGYPYYTISTPYAKDKLGIKLLYSDDYGKSWYRHTGVDDKIDTYKVNDTTMFFYNEPNNLFSYVDFVQCGKDYQDAKDNYVYMYCKLTHPTPSLYLARVKRGHLNIVDKSKYEYFQAYDGNNNPLWSSDISSSGVVMTFDQGYYHSAFLPSVVYNSALDLFIMTVGARYEDRFGGKPSTLSFFWSKNPWGKWTRFYHTNTWVGDSPDNILYQPKFISKFTSEDGKTMYINYSDCRNNWGYNYVYTQQELTLVLDESAHYNLGEEIIINVEASDLDGKVEKVEYYSGDVLLEEDVTSPYQYVWKNAPSGTHEITAVAYDNEGTKTSSSIFVTVTGK